MHIPSTIVFFDLETGGLEPKHPIIQIAAVAVGRGWRELGTFQRKLQFAEHQCQREALEHNCYDAATWEREAVPTLQAVAEFGSFLNNHQTVEMVSKRTGKPYKVARLAGYNCESFDKPRIMELFRQSGQFLPADPRMLDVFQLAMWSFTFDGKVLPDFKLGTVARHLGVDASGAHEALADVRMTIDVAKRVRLGRELPVTDEDTSEADTSETNTSDAKAALAECAAS